MENGDLVPQEVANISPKIPPFWKPNPKIWFVQIEAQFRRYRIHTDQAKFDYVVSSIDADILSHVSDILADPPADGKYIALKDKLISVFEESDTKKFQTLLTGIELGDQKPSQLLSKMRSLADKKVSDDFMKALWLKQLPLNAQTILSISNENLSKLSELADTIVEVTANQQTFIPSVASVESNDPKISELQHQLSELSFEVQSIRKERQSNMQSTARQSGVGNSSSKQSLCYYHFNFGGRARKCLPPCLLSHVKLDQENSIPQTPRRRDRRGQN
jgi:hypothetical protein